MVQNILKTVRGAFPPTILALIGLLIFTSSVITKDQLIIYRTSWSLAVI